jgi:hypothetical protein
MAKQVRINKDQPYFMVEHANGVLDCEQHKHQLKLDKRNEYSITRVNSGRKKVVRTKSFRPVGIYGLGHRVTVNGNSFAPAVIRSLLMQQVK